MSEKKRARLVRRQRILPIVGRGPVYSWLWVHHDAVKALREIERRPWPLIILDMEEDGVRPVNGDALSVRNVRHIWQRVVADALSMATARAAHAAAKPPLRPPVNQPPLAAVQPLPFRSQEVVPTFRRPAPSALAGGLPTTDFPITDPAGNPLPEGHVFYDGRVVNRRYAVMKEGITREFKEMDRGK